MGEHDQDELDQRLLSEAIDRSLNAKRKGPVLIRLFLLGAGESGKSTVLKQLRLLHNDGFTDFERRNYSHVIWVDLIESMKLLILNARKYRIALDCDQPNSPLVPYKRIILLADRDNNVAGEYAVGYSREKPLNLVDSALDDNFDPLLLPKLSIEHSRDQIGRAVQELWANDRGIRACFEQANKFQLEPSALYYFDNVMKFADRNYLCSDRDIIIGRIKTTGITENTFHVKSTTLKVLDAGGQRLERKKWIHFFQDIDAIVFVLAVLEYDQTLYEDGRVNRMDESLELFGLLCNSRWFRNTPFILFLNKVDLLQRKLQRLPITDHFPDYDRDPHDVDQVLDYFEGILLKMNQTLKPIYVHRTCATDTASMLFVLNAVTDMMILQNLKKSGIM